MMMMMPDLTPSSISCILPLATTSRSLSLPHRLQPKQPISLPHRSLCLLTKQPTERSLCLHPFAACRTPQQEMVFKVAGVPMVENCMGGYNSWLLVCLRLRKLYYRISEIPRVLEEGFGVCSSGECKTICRGSNLAPKSLFSWTYNTITPPDVPTQDDVRSSGAAISHNCCSSSSIDSGPGIWPAGETNKQQEVKQRAAVRGQVFTTSAFALLHAIALLHVLCRGDSNSSNLTRRRSGSAIDTSSHSVRGTSLSSLPDHSSGEAFILLVRQLFFHDDSRNFTEVGGGVTGCRWISFKFSCNTWWFVTECIYHVDLKYASI